MIVSLLVGGIKLCDLSFSSFLSFTTQHPYITSAGKLKEVGGYLEATVIALIRVGNQYKYVWVGVLASIIWRCLWTLAMICNSDSRAIVYLITKTLPRYKHRFATLVFLEPIHKNYLDQLIKSQNFNMKKKKTKMRASAINWRVYCWIYKAHLNATYANWF